MISRTISGGGGVVAAAALTASVLAASLAHAHAGESEPDHRNPGMERMHQLHMHGNPGMQRMHELHLEHHDASHSADMHRHGR